MRFLSKIFIPTEQNPRFHRFLSKMRISTEHILFSVEINSQSWLLPKNRRQKVCDEEKITVVHCSTVEKHVETCKHNFGEKQSKIRGFWLKRPKL